MDRYRGKIENICENKRTFFYKKTVFFIRKTLHFVEKSVVYLKKMYSFFEKFYRKSMVKCRKKLYFLVFLVDIWNVYGVKGEIV